METLTPLPTPAFIVQYNQRNISSDIAPFVLSVSYTDKLTGESDEVEIQLEDTDGRWRGSWYPQKGDTISLQLGYEGTRLLPCGEFQIDELALEGPPDVVTIRGLASGFNQELRTKTSRAYESQSLRQVAEQVASRHGLSLVGNIADLKLDRVTQHREGDLAFLKRLANAYGYAFSVRGKQLVFYDLVELDAGRAVLVLKRGDMKRYSLRDKSDAVYRACEVSYFDPATQRLVKHLEQNPNAQRGDVLKLNERCESRAHAEARAKAALRASKGRETTGSFTVPGDQRLVSGNNLEIADMGTFNGRYQIKEARHVIARSGYEASVEVARVS